MAVHECDRPAFAAGDGGTAGASAATVAASRPPLVGSAGRANRGALASGDDASLPGCSSASGAGRGATGDGRTNAADAGVEIETTLRRRIPLPAQAAIGVALLANIVFFSIMGGALLTRYLLPLYPLVLLECVTTWRRRVRHWELLVTFSVVAFVAGIFINPPYRFAPEDNLNYRDMIVLQQRGINEIATRYPQAIVLTTWPATDEMSKRELGYVRKPISTVAIENFSLPELARARADAGAYDTALIFSTRFGSPAWHRWRVGATLLPSSPDYDFESTLTAREAAFLLHGVVVWQASHDGLWVAVLRFNRSASPQKVDALLLPNLSVRRAGR